MWMNLRGHVQLKGEEAVIRKVITKLRRVRRQSIDDSRYICTESSVEEPYDLTYENSVLHLPTSQEDNNQYVTHN